MATTVHIFTMKVEKNILIQMMVVILLIVATNYGFTLEVVCPLISMVATVLMISVTKYNLDTTTHTMTTSTYSGVCDRLL